MSYRIQVLPEAGSLLQTFAPHVVLRLGQALAEMAEAISAGSDPEGDTLRIEDCVMQFVVDHADRLLRVIHIEQAELAPAFSEAHAHA